MRHDQTQFLSGSPEPQRGDANALPPAEVPLAASFRDAAFVDAVCGTVVPHLFQRNRPTASFCPVEGRADPLQAGRVEEFVQLLLQEGDNGCEDFAFREAASGADPQRMAADYLGPAARLIGDYWRMDICDFMQVTVCMTRIQRLFRLLVDECPPNCEARPGFSILLSPVPGDQHSFGQSIVEDAFQRRGWQVDTCCFDEEDHLYVLAANNEYRIIGLSISGERFLPAMAAAAFKLRRRSLNVDVRIMAGGSLVAALPASVLDAGADLLAGDAGEAVDMAESAVAAKNDRLHIACALG